MVALVVLLAATIASGEVIKSGSLQASSDGVNVTLRWITDDESNILRFDVERSSGIDGNFTSIGSLDRKGPSVYEFVDHSAFMRTATIYQYRVMMVYTDGSRVPTSALTVSHTVSGVRRTWGSIKSLFR
jgi:hypothetical protein